MHDALNVESYKIISSLHYTLGITYTARAPACWTPSTDSRSYDDVGTKGLSAFSVANDYHLNAIQNWTDTTSCKENGLVSLF